MHGKQDHPGTDSITLSGQTIFYSIRRSLRASRIRLEVKPESGLTVVLPRRYRFGDIIEFIQSKSAWVLNCLDKCSRQQIVFRVKDARDGGNIPYLGREIALSIKPSAEQSAWLSFEGDRLLLGMGKREDGIASVLEEWYRSGAASLFQTKLKSFGSLMGIPFRRLSIRGQKTRWGSCSRNGTVSLNWKLMFLPEPVIDYVIVHELAHIREMNHSAKFWGIVQNFCPDYKRYRRYLKTYPNGNNHPQLLTYTNLWI